ncbi:hypothetical protein BGLT_02239 [Caballeronia glathei]|uniref:Uncharacterized protein n=1 Tax=Caballeronia glathei TaxID=60547 RepID=A0A069PW65_9BURK|nr:hypothetical protein [Caballeronia glathei]KDR41596.1 hypothetical protein BG61_16850 [Caballeronia glathei]CDY79458.1 hypothetical protein BGLT_02239 [Caballeronia glathei]
MFKDQIASDVRSSNLAWNEREVKSIDRITALGMSDQLGAALFRFKYGSDGAAGKRALHLLTHKATRSLGIEMTYARKLATACLLEFVADTCEKCNGTGIVMKSGHSDGCKKCEGSGLKRYSDTERALAAGLPIDSFKAKHLKKFDQVMTCLMGSVAATGGKVRHLLREAA